MRGTLLYGGIGRRLTTVPQRRFLTVGDPFLFFPAATLGHHALEMYLKSAMIASGMTVFNQRELKSLDAGVNLAEADCAWGHNLVKLAETLAQRNAVFNPSKQMNIVGYLTIGPDSRCAGFFAQDFAIFVESKIATLTAMVNLI